MSAVSNFDFVGEGSAAVLKAALRAEGFARCDPRASGFYARLALELASDRLLKRDRRRFWTPRPSLKDTIAAITEDASDAPVDALHSVRRLGNHAVHVESPAFLAADAVACARSLHAGLEWIAVEARWPRPARPFDESLLRDRPGHLRSSAEDVQRLQNELDALTTRHGTLAAQHQDLAARHDVLEAIWLEQVDALDALHRDLADARATVVRLQDEVAHFEAALGTSVPRADLDALREALARREAAYRSLLAHEGITATRFMAGKGLLSFEGLVALAGDDERPDEQDEASAVILERLAARTAGLFASLPTFHV